VSPGERNARCVTSRAPFRFPYNAAVSPEPLPAVATSRSGAGLGAPLVFLVALMVAAAGVASHSLWTPDEPTGAAVGAAMARTGDFVVPRLGGHPFLEKPPLFWWIEATGFRWFGITDWVARLPAACFTLMTLGLTALLGRRIGGQRVGWLAVLVLAGTVEFSEDMGRVVVDPALVCGVALCHLGLVLALTGAGARDRLIATLALCIGLSGAFLAKGVVGAGLGVAVPAFAALLIARMTAVRRLAAPLACACVVATLAVVPWALALLKAGGPAALRECLVGNTVGRLVETSATRAYGHRQPFWYYLGPGAIVLLPWVIALPATLRASRAQAPGEPRTGRQLLLLTAALGVAGLSLAATKRGLYLLPLLPAAAVAISWWLAGVNDRKGQPGREWDQPTLVVLLAMAGLTSALLGGAAAVCAWFPGWVPRWAPLARGLSPLGLRIIVVVGAGVAARALARLIHHHRHRTAPSPEAVALLFAALLVGWQAGVKALLDPLKELHSLTAAIGQALPGRGPVPADRPSEALLGIVGFDLARDVTPLRSLSDLATACSTGGAVVFAKPLADRLPPEARARWIWIYDETGRKASPFGIASCAPGTATRPARPGTVP
jgi:4-amino-4-deoxy-L-arabinose transferase-like glycosyltransferase